MNIIIVGGNSNLCRQLMPLYQTDKNNFIFIDKKFDDNFLSGKKYTCDICDLKNVNETIEKIVERYHCIDVLVNMAYKHINDDFLNYDPVNIKKALEVNFLGGINVTAQILRIMMQNNGGKIINISSSAAYDKKFNTLTYAMSKAAMNCMTQYIAQNYIQYNISATAICPTVVYTDAVKINIQAMTQNGELPEKILEEYCSDLNPQKRMLYIQEIKVALDVIMKDTKNSLNGLILPINCGSYMR